MPPTGTLLSPTGKQTVYTAVTVTFPEPTPANLALREAALGWLIDQSIEDVAAAQQATVDHYLAARDRALALEAERIAS